MTNDAVVEWVWATQVMFTAASDGNGAINGDSNGWYGIGGSVTVTAVPHIYHHFAAWTGDTQVVGSDAVLTLTLDQPRAVVARFAENQTTNGVPEWWLAQYGLTNFNADAMRDVDKDGMPTWQEWVAGCDPTNGNSVFRFTSAEGAPGQGMVVRWPSISNRFYGLARSTNLMLATNGFLTLPGASNMPATPSINSYTDGVQGVGPYFYRIDVRQ